MRAREISAVTARTDSRRARGVGACGGGVRSERVGVIAERRDRLADAAAPALRALGTFPLPGGGLGAFLLGGPDPRNL